MLNLKRVIVAIGVLGLLLMIWWIGSPLLFDQIVDESIPQEETIVASEMTEEEMKTEEETETEEIKVYTGTFMDGVKNYKTTGTVQTIVTGDTISLRFEDFETTNGPDLFVYLVTPGTETDEGINLGVLKGNKGNQNYEIPNNVDLSVYSKVVIWCKAFNSDFGFAELE